MGRSFDLAGLDGTNPLGFLAALGTLVSLAEARVGEPRLGWRRGPRWVPILEGVGAEDEQELSRVVAEALRGATVPPDAERRRAEAQAEMEKANTAIKKKRDEIKGRRLGRVERAEAEERELRPLQRDYEEKRRVWLETLRESVPRPELALGRGLDFTTEEYRAHAEALAVAARPTSRGPLDLLAAFGSDACPQANSNRIEPTPFCFTPRGASQQYFLDTVRQLVHAVSPDAVHRVLFRPWDYRDERLSMRWDPIEDRRYALMDRDPTASDNKPRTMWMANLLAYRALTLFPSAPGRRLATTGWDIRGSTFTWPLWGHPLGVDGIRSLIQLRELIEERPDAAALRARGIVAVYRAQRIEVGKGVNLNFSPARQVA